MGAVGTINSTITGKIKSLFEKRCVEMIEWACKTLKNQKTIDMDWGEENITANIFVLIHESQKSIDYDIHPECEFPFYDEDILNNKKKAKSAHRIDLVFQYNWQGHRFSFYMEAKNLIEMDVLKTGRKRKTKASVILNRYIDTGIDHYVKKYYPFGCILGYVLIGSISGIIEGINTILEKNGRSDERLQYRSGDEPWVRCESHHSSLAKPIEHYLFKFV